MSENEERDYAVQNAEEFQKFVKKVIAFYRSQYFGTGFKINLNTKCYETLMGAFFAGKNCEQTCKIIHDLHSVKKEDLTDAEKKFVELEFQRCTTIKQFYDEYNDVLKSLLEEGGMGHHFQEHGVVYQLAKPSGTFVEYKDVTVNRTRYEFEIAEGKRSASLSMKDAQALGYEVKGKEK